jgi:hypothetical protein
MVSAPSGLNDGVSGQSNQPQFIICTLKRPVLTRIPKGARPRAATEFERRLRAVTSDSDDLEKWEHLFAFAPSLMTPDGGKLGVGI